MEQLSSFESPVADQAREAQLALLRENLTLQMYPGYPDYSDRLVADPLDFGVTEKGQLIVPDGPWTIDNYSPQRTSEHAPDGDLQQMFVASGLELDAAGRPLHPWFSNMVSDPTLGVVLGKGAYWRWGPNYTADSIVLCRDHVLLIKRKDTGLWALPGGYVDAGEAAAMAASREVTEETGVRIPRAASSRIVYQGPVVDLRMTGNAWPETTAIRYDLPADMLPHVEGRDDAKEAAWVPVTDALTRGELFGSHQYLLEQAIA